MPLRQTNYTHVDAAKIVGLYLVQWNPLAPMENVYLPKDYPDKCHVSTTQQLTRVD